MASVHAHDVPVSKASVESSTVTEPRAGHSALGGRGLSPTELSEAEKILEELEAARYHRGLAAERLGMSRTTLWRKMKQYRL